MKKTGRMPSRRFWIIAAILVVIAAGSAAVGSWWALPRYHARRTIPAYLEKNQRNFRAGSVAPGAFNQLHLTDISLGDSARPLLNAPTGRMVLDYAAGRRTADPVFRELELDHAGLAMTVKGREIRLNDIPLEEFMERITDLPAAPDGAMIPLAVHADFQFGRGNAAQLHFSVRPGAHAGEFELNGRWQSESSGERGAWNACWERATGNLSVTIEGDLALPFWQEILLRAREPELMAALIRTGKMTGKGLFTAHLPEFSVSDFTFSGTLSQAAFSFQALELRAAQPFEFSLHKNGQSCVWKAPAVELSGKVPVPLTNVVLERKAKRAEVKFRADADLRGALARLLQEECHFSAASAAPVIRHIAGSIHAKTLVWDFSGTAPEQEPGARELLFEGGANRSLSIALDTLAIHGHGKGAAGSVDSHLGLHSLALNLPEGSFKADRIDLRSTRELGEHGAPGDHLEFHCNKLVGDTPRGQCEIAGLSGAVTIHRPASDRAEQQWIAHGDALLLFSPVGEIRSDDWQLTAAATRSAADWQLTTLDVQSGGQTAVRYRADTGVLANLKLHLDGTLANGKIAAAGLRLRAAGLTGKRLKGKNMDAGFRWDGASAKWQGELRAGALEIPVTTERPWNAVNCLIRLGGNGFTLPEQLEIEADTLAAAYAGWSADFRGGKWLLSRQGNDVSCQSSAAALHAVSPRREAGSGDLADARIQTLLRLAPDGKVAEWTADVESQHPSWSWLDLHSSGEKGKFSIRFRADAAAPYSGSVQLQNGTFIGTYFSVTAPELSARTEYSPVSGGQGVLDFRHGTITSPDGRLELKEAALHLPLCLGANHADQPSAGTLTSGEVRLDGENQGPFTAELQTSGTRLAAQGTVKVRRFGSALLNLQSVMQLPPGAPAFQVRLDLPLAQLTEPWELGRFLPALSGVTVLRGALAISAQLECANGKTTAAATVAAENSDWQIGNAALEGVTARADFSDFRSLVTRAAFPVTARRFVWNDYELTDNRATLALPEAGKISCSAWQAKYGQGTVELTSPVETAYQTSDAPQAAVPLHFNAEHIPLADFLHKLGLSAVASDAAVSGRIAASYQAGKLHFGESHLGFRNAAGEILKMLEVEGAIIRMKDPVYQAFVQAVLREVRCTSGDFDFGEDGRELVMKITADGRPVHPVPFVYQGHNAPSLFRPAQPGETGFDGEIQLKVKLKMSAPAYRTR